jgi:Phage portal protein, lambda family
MGKNNKKNRSVSPRAGTNAVSAVASTGGNGPYLLLGSGFQAAGASPSRGYLYWPTLDTRRQITSFTRYEIARRIQWLYWHFGFARRLVNGMARMQGYLTPQPCTADEDWNELAFEVFMGLATSAETWDRAGKFDFFQGQIQDNISIYRDGDTLAVLTETPTARARFAYYEAHQINSFASTVSLGFTDGCKLDSFGKHLAYSLRDGEDPSLYTTVDARNAIYMGNFETRGQVRPLSILATAVLNMIDVVEARGFTKHALKAHSRIGTVIEQDMGQIVAPGGGFAGPVIQGAYTMPDGTTQNVNMEMVMDGAQIPTLQPGQRVKVVADDRPTPNNMEFEKTLLRDCAYSADLSYERLCDMAGITGPGLRMLNADDKRWIKLKHYTQAKRCNRQYVYALAKEMKAGRLPLPKLPAGQYWWNKCQWIGLANPDIDGGRTAAGTLTDLQSGQTHWLEEWGKKGVYWKRGAGQAIDEIVWVTLECIRRSKLAGLPEGLITPEKVFPQRFSIVNAQMPIEPAQPGDANFKADTSDADDTPEGTD